MSAPKSLLHIFALIFFFSLCFLGGRFAAWFFSSTPSSSSILFSSETWGLGYPEEGKLPAGNATIEELSDYHAYYAKDTTEKIIYLTFDCGYDNGCIVQILDTLKEKQVPAAFFVTGDFLDSSPKILKRIVKEGHIVGNHTDHHPDMSEISSLSEFEKELSAVEEAYQEITGGELPRYYRPPRGKYSIENLKQADSLGYSTIFWSLAHVDWLQDDQPSKEEAFEKLLGRIHPGAVVLLHSTSSANASFLGELLDQWRDRGYQFQTLDELTASALTKKEDAALHPL